MLLVRSLFVALLLCFASARADVDIEFGGSAGRVSTTNAHAKNPYGFSLFATFPTNTKWQLRLEYTHFSYFDDLRDNSQPRYRTMHNSYEAIVLLEVLRGRIASLNSGVGIGFQRIRWAGPNPDRYFGERIDADHPMILSFNSELGFHLEATGPVTWFVKTRQIVVFGPEYDFEGSLSYQETAEFQVWLSLGATIDM